MDKSSKVISALLISLLCSRSTNKTRLHESKTGEILSVSGTKNTLSEYILRSDESSHCQPWVGSKTYSKDSIRISTDMTLKEIEKSAIQQALMRNDWKKMATARELGIDKNTLRRKIIRLGIIDPKSSLS
jgi:DNA-binding NtrC family response regulator